MRGVGTFVSWIGGGLSRAGATGFAIGICLIVFGMTPGELIAYVWLNPPGWVDSGFLRLGLLVVGMGVVGLSLHLNQWSQRQKAIDSLAEDISWAIHDLLNRSPRPTSDAEIDRWKVDFDSWCSKVSKKLENRAFFTRADQLHFDRLGFVPTVGMTGNQRFDHLLSMLSLKFERLRDVINWTQQRRQ